MASFDFNTLFSDPLKNLTAARYAFQRTEIGRSGLIRIELDENKKIAYTLITSGEKFSDYETAFSKASSLMITKYNIITPITRGKKGEISIPLESAYNPKTEQASEFLRVINSEQARRRLVDHREQLQKLGMPAEEIEELISGTRQISIQLSQVKDQVDVKNYAIDFIKRQLKKLDPTKENLFPFIDKDGGNILKFTSFSTTGSVGQFSNAQIHYILNAIGFPMLDETSDLFGAKSIEDFLQKLPKRFKGMFSERDMTIFNQDVESALGKGKTLDDSVLIIEEGLDFLRKAMGVKARSDDVAEAIISSDAEEIIRSSFIRQIKQQKPGKITSESFTDANQLTKTLFGEGGSLRGILETSKTNEEFLAAVETSLGKDSSQFKMVKQLFDDAISADANQLTKTLFGEGGSLRSILETSKTNKEFLAAVETSLGKDSSQFKMVKKLFDDAEKELDGDAVINKEVFKATKKRLRSQLKDYRARIAAGETDEVLMESANNVQRQLDLLDRSDLYQITGRGFLEEGQPKFAAQVRAMSKGLSKKYAMVIGRSGMKKELGLGGKGEGALRQIILSGFGESKGIVYSDPNLLATHPEIFASENALKAMQENSSKVLAEMNQAIAQDMLSPKTVENLKKQLETDITGLPEATRQAKLRNRRFAQEILKLHEMGIGPKNSPAMMNLLANYFQTEMFTMEEGKYGTLFHPVLPNTQRFALATEASHGLASAPGFKSILGKGEVETSFSKLNEAGEVFSRNLMTFRIHSFEGAGPRLLFGAGKVPEFFNALGGFDLDDKGLPTIIKYRDDKNVERILFSLTRQPTSFQENIYARATLDQETLRQLFSGNKDFIKTITEMTQENESDNFLKYIKSSLEGTQSTLTGVDGNLLSDEIIEAELEKRILFAYNKMGRSITSVYEDNGRILRQIEEFGSTALTSQEFKRSNLKLIEEFDKAKRLEFGLAFPEIKDDLIKSVESFKELLDEDTFKKLNSAIQSDDISAVSDILSKKGTSNDVALQSIREMSLISRLGRGTESADILGSYINRSMVIGSTLNQFDDFMEAFINNSTEKDFLYGDGIKLISSELAIDKSTGFSLQKNFLLERSLEESVRRQIDQADSISAVKVLQSLIKKKGTTVNQIGEEAIIELGSRVGKMAGLHQTAINNREVNLGRKLTKQEAEDLFPIIDKLFLTSKRLSENDQYLFAEGILKGLTETEKKYGLSERSKEIKDLLESSISRQSRKDTLKIVEEQFGTSTGKYARSSAVQNQMAEIHGIQQQMLRMNLSRIRSDQIVAGTQTTEEAMTAARLIIEKNKDALQAAMILKDASETETVSQTGRQIELGKKIISDFEESMNIMSGQTTRQNLFDALEKQAQRMGVRFTTDDVIRTLHGPDELNNFAAEMIAAKTNRIANFYGSIETNQLATRVRESFGRAKARIQGDNFYDENFNAIDFNSEEIQKQIRQNALEEAPDDEARAVMKMMFDEENALEGLSQDQAARVREARGLYGAAEMQERITQETQDNLTSTGRSAPKVEKESKFSAQLRNMLAGEEYSEAADRASYKRISKFIKEDLSDLFSQNKVFRNSIYGMGALIAGSLIYSSIKDRAPENVGGPSLLPGGSAYEAYPERSPQIPSANPYAYSPGMSYKVNLYGNRSEIEDFTQLFGGFGGNIDIDTTMYSGIPQVGRDPYQEIASSY